MSSSSNIDTELQRSEQTARIKQQELKQKSQEMEAIMQERLRQQELELERLTQERSLTKDQRLRVSRLIDLRNDMELLKEIEHHDDRYTINDLVNVVAGSCDVVHRKDLELVTKYACLRDEMEILERTNALSDSSSPSEIRKITESVLPSLPFQLEASREWYIKFISEKSSWIAARRIQLEAEHKKAEHLGKEREEQELKEKDLKAKIELMRSILHREKEVVQHQTLAAELNVVGHAASTAPLGTGLPPPYIEK